MLIFRMDNYQKTLDYLFTQLPMYQRVGKSAFKKNLDNILALSEHLGQPSSRYPSVHLAGTNGKGSTTHILAAFLQKSGYKVGVYTSPHYRDFRERIKINGQLISKEKVVEFVAKNRAFLQKLQPSFFEITVAMAFDYFAAQKVDIALIETGLGGRLDSTNIIRPILSIITNIGLDHESMLGDTLPLIAAEKAGIIKKNTPLIVGESHSESSPVFIAAAQKMNASILFADQEISIKNITNGLEKATYRIESKNYPQLNFAALESDLTGNYQHHNLRNALAATLFLAKNGFDISRSQIIEAALNIKGISKMIGRWQLLQKQPLTIADSAHNADGLQYISQALQEWSGGKLHFVYGTVNDKNLDKILPLLPQNATYYFCKAAIPRGLNSVELSEKAKKTGLNGLAYSSVKMALEAAQAAAQKEDLIFVGGSIFVAAEVV